MLSWSPLRRYPAIGRDDLVVAASMEGRCGHGRLRPRRGVRRDRRAAVQGVAVAVMPVAPPALDHPPWWVFSWLKRQFAALTSSSIILAASGGSVVLAITLSVFLCAWTRAGPRGGRTR